jgi:hypothetical protein
MKTKFQYKTLIFLIVSLFFLSITLVDAQPVKAKTKVYLNRTNVVLRLAANQVKTNKVYTGNLTKAIDHQKFAQELFTEGKFQKAIFHSHRARVLAHLVIEANKGKVNSDMKDSNAESELLKDMPADGALDAEAPVTKGMDDQKAASAAIRDIK